MKAQTQRRLRQIHHYVGVFFAPLIILFTISGAMQTFRLQEEKGYGGTPPGWIVWMAAVHKDSSLPRVTPPKPPEAAKAMTPEKPKGQPAAASEKKRSKLPLQIFVVLLSLGLLISTVLGVVIALNNRAMRRATIILLIAGTLVPLALLYV